MSEGVPEATLRRPAEGDELTLFNIAEIAHWTRQGQSTIRRWIATGKIGPEYLTRPGGKIFMTGDQLARLIKSWHGGVRQHHADDRGASQHEGRRTRIKRTDPFKQNARAPIRSDSRKP